MEIKKTKDNTFTIDFKTVQVAINASSDKADIVLFSSPQDLTPQLTVFSTPGEYEVKNCMIDGVAISESTTAYCLTVEDMRVAYIDAIEQPLTDQQQEAFAAIDVLVTTIHIDSATPTTKLIAQLEPKLVIVASDHTKVLDELQKDFGGDVKKEEKFKISKKELTDTEKQALVILQ